MGNGPNGVQTNVRECGMLCRKVSGEWKMGKVVQTNVKGLQRISPGPVYLHGASNAF